MARRLLYDLAMNREQLQERTKAYAVSAARLARRFADDPITRQAAAQLIRSSASVAANYRSTGLARSRKEFLAKLGVVAEEADESVFWLEYVESVHTSVPEELATVKTEGQQLVWILKAALRTCRRNSQ